MRRRATNRSAGTNLGPTASVLFTVSLAATAAWAVGVGAPGAAASGRTASAVTSSAPPPNPLPTLKASVVPSVAISRAATTAGAPRTNPPQASPAPPAATQAPRAQASTRTTVALGTTLPPATVASTDVAPPTAVRTAGEAATTVAASTTTIRKAAVGDSGASHRNSRIAWALALMGLLIGGLTVWFWYTTRPVPGGMTALVAMGSSRWRRSDARRREAILARSRRAPAPAEAVFADATADAPAMAGPAPVAEPVPSWARDHEPAPVPARPALSGSWATVVAESESAGGPVVADDDPSSFVDTGELPVVPFVAGPGPVPPRVAPAPVPALPPHAPWAAPTVGEQLAVEPLDAAASAADHG